MDIQYPVSALLGGNWRLSPVCVYALLNVKIEPERCTPLGGRISEKSNTGGSWARIGRPVREERIGCGPYECKSANPGPSPQTSRFASQARDIEILGSGYFVRPGDWGFDRCCLQLSGSFSTKPAISTIASMKASRVSLLSVSVGSIIMASFTVVGK